jgi:uncharacterized phage protein (TIGR02216 family)
VPQGSAIKGALPWDNLVRLGIISLKIPADEFWQMSPSELAVFFPKQQSKALTKLEFAELQQQFPDKSWQK